MAAPATGELLAKGLAAEATGEGTTAALARARRTDETSAGA